MTFDLEAEMDRRIAEILAELPPPTDEECRGAAAIFATARPLPRLHAAS